MVKELDPAIAPEIVLVLLFKVAVVDALIFTGLEIVTAPFAIIVPLRLTAAGKAALKPLVKVVLPEAELRFTFPRLLKLVAAPMELVVPRMSTL